MENSIDNLGEAPVVAENENTARRFSRERFGRGFCIGFATGSVSAFAAVIKVPLFDPLSLFLKATIVVGAGLLAGLFWGLIKGFGFCCRNENRDGRSGGGGGRVINPNGGGNISNTGLGGDFKRPIFVMSSQGYDRHGNLIREERLLY